MSQTPYGRPGTNSSPREARSPRHPGSPQEHAALRASDPTSMSTDTRPRSHTAQLPSLASLTSPRDFRGPRTSDVHSILNVSTDDGSKASRRASLGRQSDDSAISPLTRPGEGSGRVHPRGASLSPSLRAAPREPLRASNAPYESYRVPAPPFSPSEETRPSSSQADAARFGSGTFPPTAGVTGREQGQADHGQPVHFGRTASTGARSEATRFGTGSGMKRETSSIPLPPPISTNSQGPSSVADSGGHRAHPTSSPYSATATISATSSSSFPLHGASLSAGADAGGGERLGGMHASEPLSAGGSSYTYMPPLSFPIDMQAASRVADEKRRRNAGASARFRARRKEKEQANTREIDELRMRIRELEEDAEFYRRERDYFVAHLYNAPDRDHHFPRPPSPRQIRMRRAQAGLSSAGPPSYLSGDTTYQEHGHRGSEGRQLRRRLTGEYGSGQLEISAPVPASSSSQPPPPPPPPPPAYGSTPRYGAATPYATGQHGPSPGHSRGPQSPPAPQYFGSGPEQGYGPPGPYTLPPPGQTGPGARPGPVSTTRPEEYRPRPPSDGPRWTPGAPPSGH